MIVTLLYLWSFSTFFTVATRGSGKLCTRAFLLRNTQPVTRQSQRAFSAQVPAHFHGLARPALNSQNQYLCPSHTRINSRQWRRRAFNMFYNGDRRSQHVLFFLMSKHVLLLAPFACAHLTSSAAHATTKDAFPVSGISAHTNDERYLMSGHVPLSSPQSGANPARLTDAQRRRPSDTRLDAGRGVS